MRPSVTQVRVDFSFRREVFFVVVGSVLGAITMVVPKTLFEMEMGLPYYLTWIVFGHIVGVYSPASALAGMAIHMIAAISIGIAIGIFLYKTGILNISKLSNGFLYGIFAGTVVFIVFFIPVQQFVLAPEMARTMTESGMTESQAQAYQQMSSNLVTIMIGSLIMHLVFGITVGVFSSLLSVRFGARYRCSKCDVSFSRIDLYRKHIELVHGKMPIKLKRILILGGGFAGVQVLRKLQDAFQNDITIDITLVSKDNFFLFTPLLPEVSSGMIETNHIVTPVRVFCKRAKFYEAVVESIDLDSKQVAITHTIGKESNPVDLYKHALDYDYLVLALGSKTNFFGISDIEKNAFTIKSLGDAMILRNHLINMLEQADLEHENHDLRKNLLTFVVVGGGFAGVETVGELNDFVRDSIRNFYHNIESSDARVILVNSGERLLPEVSDDLAEFALQRLEKSGVEVMSNTRLTGATINTVKLSDGTIVPTHTLIWTGGIMPSQLIKSISCKHDKGGRVVANNYLEADGYSNIFAVGDCASVEDPYTGKLYPPTAQHAIREGNVVAQNIISAIKGGKKVAFDYKTKGVMAIVGKRNGVGNLFGYKVHGFVAWWIWRLYYWANLPTTEKKLRVMVDWTVDIFFNRDVTRLKTFAEEKILSSSAKKTEVMLE